MFTFGLSKLENAEDFFSSFFSSGLGGGGGSGLATASRVLALDASTLNREQKKLKPNMQCDYKDRKV